MYFGGCERPNAIHTLAKAGGRRVMISYAEPPSQTCWDLYRHYGIELILDSGAFSAWKRSIKINLQDYMDYIRRHGMKLYFNLDVVGDTEATARNQAAMEVVGLNPIPVFHYGEPWELLDRLVNKYSLVGLGGTVGLGPRKKERFFEGVFARHPEGKFHALGIAYDRYLRQFPFDSADSVWWLYKFRDSQRRFSEGDRKNEQVARVRHLLELEKSVRRYQVALLL